MSETMPSDPTNSPSAVPQRTAADLEASPRAVRVPEVELVLLRASGPPLEEAVAQHGGVVDVQKLQDSPGIQFLVRAVGDVCHLLVDVHSAPLRVGNPDAFLRGLDDGAVPLLTFLQRPVGLDARRDVT